jgi:membrane protein YqaA with SNARE-associated domain
MGDIAAYLGLFSTSLVAGTFLPFLPGASEMALGGLLATGAGEPLGLIALASTGALLGSTVNYLIGRNVAGLSQQPWFPIRADTLERASDRFQRYGVWTLLLAWIPTFGDAISVVAGLLRTDLRLFLVLVGIAKAFGHLAIAGGVTWMVS